MKASRFLIALAMLAALLIPAPQASADSSSPLAGDALQPPTRPSIAGAADDPTPNLYQPSAFLAGKVAVQIIFVESNGAYEPSTRDWSNSQISAVSSQVGAALAWWSARLPNAQLSFDLTSRIVQSGYEPVLHGLAGESQWVGDTLHNLGITAPNYFDQAYAADAALRRERHADWATNIFVVNSAGTADGRLADGHFAYAYISGPFMVITSDAGPYGTHQIAPVVAHEFGHIFGALDQYAAAAVPCAQKSGYLSVPNSNSQANNCGTKYASIMLEPLTAYANGTIDQSALGQIGYRDSDSDSLPDPLDTAPTLQVQINQPSASARPTLTGTAVDQPYASPTGDQATINPIARIEYRIDGGAWVPLAPADGAYDGIGEAINAVLPLYDGQHTVGLRATNRVGASSAIASYTVALSGLGADPGYQISVPQISNSQAITLTLATPAGASVQISEDPYFSGAAWAPARPAFSWNLRDGEGPHWLYARFRSASGLESPVQVVGTTLDRTPPLGRALLVTRSNSTWIEIYAQDSATQISSMQITFSRDGTAAWQPFAATLPISIQSSTIYVRLRDEAGNVSVPIQALPTTPVWLPIAAK